MSIRLRLTLIQTAILGIVLTAFAVVVYMVVARELDQRLDYTVHLSGLEAKRALNDVTKDHGAGIHPFTLPDSSEYGGVALYVQLVSADGTVLQRSSNLEKDLPVNLDHIQKVLAEEKDTKNTYVDSIDFRGERLAVYSAAWELDPGEGQASSAAETLRLGMASPSVSPSKLETLTNRVRATSQAQAVEWRSCKWPPPSRPSRMICCAPARCWSELYWRRPQSPPGPDGAWSPTPFSPSMR